MKLGTSLILFWMYFVICGTFAKKNISQIKSKSTHNSLKTHVVATKPPPLYSLPFTLSIHTINRPNRLST